MYLEYTYDAYHSLLRIYLPNFNAKVLPFHLNAKYRRNVLIMFNDTWPLFSFPFQCIVQVIGAFAEQPEEAVESLAAVLGNKGIKRIERGFAIDRLSDSRDPHAVGTA